MFSIINGKIIINRDIVIDENEAWNWASKEYLLSLYGTQAWVKKMMNQMMLH